MVEFKFWYCDKEASESKGTGEYIGCHLGLHSQL